MTDDEWKQFFLICSKVLGLGDAFAAKSQSWCAWTTFGRLGDDAGYWTGGLPRECDIDEINIKDGGVWGQPFLYSQLAHVLVPATFGREIGVGTPEYKYEEIEQDLDALSSALNSAGIDHRKTELVLEIKRY